MQGVQWMCGLSHSVHARKLRGASARRRFLAFCQAVTQCAVIVRFAAQPARLAGAGFRRSQGPRPVPAGRLALLGQLWCDVFPPAVVDPMNGSIAWRRISLRRFATAPRRARCLFTLWGRTRNAMRPQPRGQPCVSIAGLAGGADCPPCAQARGGNGRCTELRPSRWRSRSLFK